MKRSYTIALVVLVLVAAIGVAFADFRGDMLRAGIDATDGQNIDIFEGSLNVHDDVTVGDDLIADDDVIVGDDITIADRMILTATAIEITSGATTMSVADATLVTLSSPINMTGFIPSGGALGQVLILKAGAGNNTIRLDDGTSMTLGGNITLTEGQGDVIGLLCTSADGDEWIRLFNVDN